MILIKALLTLITGILLCMANISGLVKDSAGVGIAGAIVKLEKGGQTDTTESNGSFMLTFSTTGISSNINQAPPNKLSATMHNGLLLINVAEKSTVEIITFDLNGKALAIRSRSMDAGTHSIALPKRSNGVYLHKVKVGNNEFVLKGNSVGWAPSGIAVALQSSSSNNVLAKQAKSTAAINDVISITMDGQLNYRQIVTNTDTSGLVLKMIPSAGTVSDADGNVYQTVRIGNQVWMTENLRVTKYNDDSTIPFDTSETTWNSAITPKYCFYTTNSDKIKKYGALYNWYVVSPAKPKKIAPAGWHVPSDAEWDTLQNCLIAKGYNWDGTITGNKIAKSLAAKTDWYTYSTKGSIGDDLTNNNRSGFSALPGGYRSYNGTFSYQSGNGDWWCATEHDASNACSRNLYFVSDSLFRNTNYKSCGFSVRLVRD